MRETRCAGRPDLGYGLTSSLVRFSMPCQPRYISRVELDRPPRMADFVKWVTAAKPGLGWDDDTFLSAYRDNRRSVSESAFEADSVAVAIRDFVATAHPDGWEGTATQLLAEINQRASEGIRKTRSWPLTAQALGNRVERIAPLLRSQGFVVDRRTLHVPADRNRAPYPFLTLVSDATART
jgi:hypothetical protein